MQKVTVTFELTDDQVKRAQYWVFNDPPSKDFADDFRDLLLEVVMNALYAEDEDGPDIRIT